MRVAPLTIFVFFIRSNAYCQGSRLWLGVFDYTYRTRTDRSAPEESPFSYAETGRAIRATTKQAVTADIGPAYRANRCRRPALQIHQAMADVPSEHRPPVHHFEGVVFVTAAFATGVGGNCTSATLIVWNSGWFVLNETLSPSFVARNSGGMSNVTRNVIPVCVSCTIALIAGLLTATS